MKSNADPTANRGPSMAPTSSLRSRMIIHGSAILAACLVAGLVLAPGLLGKAISPEAIACGGSRNTVQAEFDLDRASDIWREFPAMLRAPELEVAKGSVHVVVFKGTVDLSGMIAGGATDDAVANAICVVTSDGDINFYDGVSRAGSKYGE